MKNLKCTLFANVGQGVCLLYIIHCAYLSVIMTGYKVNGSIGTSDLYRWEDLSWKWSEVNWMIVAIMMIVAITIALPWLKYWQDLEDRGKFRFWLLDVHSVWGKIGSFFYSLLNVVLFLNFWLLLNEGASKSTVDVDGEMLVDTNGGSVLLMLWLLLYTIYFFVSLLRSIVRICRHLLKRYRRQDRENNLITESYKNRTYDENSK